MSFSTPNPLPFPDIRLKEFFRSSLSVTLRYGWSATLLFWFINSASKCCCFFFSILRYKDNVTCYESQFSNSESVFLICYAVIMLNTDLHRANAGGYGYRQRKCMTLAQFVANLRHIEEADEAYLSNLYSSVLNNPIQMPLNTSEVPRMTVHAQECDPSTLCRGLAKAGKQVYIELLLYLEHTS